MTTIKTKPFHKRVFFLITHLNVYINNIAYKIKCKYESARGLDFSKNVTLSELNYDDQQSWGYETSANKYLDVVLESLKITHNDSIIDIGCGKGHVLTKFNNYKYNRIAGVELSEQLYAIAKKTSRY